MRVRNARTGALVGLLATAPMVSLIYLQHAWFGHEYMPLEALHARFGTELLERYLVADYILVSIPYAVWMLLMSTLAGLWLHSR